MKELPSDLEQLDPDEVVVQTSARDERLDPLVRRWPRLARDELRELRRLYSDRVRLASYGQAAATALAPIRLTRP